ncbi:MAG: hypothetical protein ACFFAS_17530 [Promethearchaeota archaeon]
MKKKEIEKNFGTKIASIVEELTKPKNKDKKEWLKTFKNHSKEAKIIKIANRIDNLKDIPTTNWSKEKIIDYAEEGKTILEQCKNSHLELEKKLEKTIRMVLNT